MKAAAYHGATVGDLHFYDVSNCASEIQSGDAATLNAYWRVTPTQTVTSP
jgi:hypothetical protein